MVKKGDGPGKMTTLGDYLRSQVVYTKSKSSKDKLKIL